MMDDKTVRIHLDEIRGRLTAIDEERDVLLNLLKGYEGWLRLRGSSNGASQLALPVPNRTKPKGKVSLRSSVLKIIKDAHGEPLHSAEILKRVSALGAQTTAKNPQAIVDLTAYSLKDGGHPVEKVDPRTWRWTGGEAEG